MTGSANPSCLGWDLCYDAGPALKPGENLVAINTKGFALPADYGYAFLGRVGPWVYPGDSETLNAKAFDLLGFQEWLVMRELEQRMVGVRAGDPYRPMKIMAPHNYMDSVLDLCARYGAIRTTPAAPGLGSARSPTRATPSPAGCPTASSRAAHPAAPRISGPGSPAI